MVKINDTTTFPITSPVDDDFVIGTDISNTTNSSGGETVSFRIKDIRGVGSEQTWQIVSRSNGTSYQNTTGKPIMVSHLGNTDNGIEVSTNNSTWVRASGSGNNNFLGNQSIIVPNGHYYRYNNSYGNKAELR